MKLSAVIPISYAAFPALPRLALSIDKHGFDEIVILFTENMSLVDVILPDTRFKLFAVRPDELHQAMLSAPTGDWLAVFYPGECIAFNGNVGLTDHLKAMTLKQTVECLPEGVWAVSMPLIDSDDAACKQRIGNAVVTRILRRGVASAWKDDGFTVGAEAFIQNLEIQRQRLCAFYLEQGNIETALQFGREDRSQIGLRHYLRAQATLALKKADEAIGVKTINPGVTAKGPGLWLNIGCNQNVLPGFENLDLHPFAGAVQCDVRLGLPYGDGMVDVITTSHMLEHLHPWRELPFVLKECYRVLAPGGVLRLSVPDLEILVSVYEDGNFDEHVATQSAVEAIAKTPFGELPTGLQFSSICFGNNSGNAIYDGHQAVWDLASMRWMLHRAGFEKAMRCWPGDSGHATLMSKYTDAHPEQSLIIEAVK